MQERIRQEAPTTMKSHETPDCNPTRLCLTVEPEHVSGFFQILQSGFMVNVRIGTSIRALLCDQFGLSPKDVAEKLTTIFLDGKPVDDIDLAIIKDGSRLSLSAAMPGLVGATMRRKGLYASFRSSITYNETERHIRGGVGTIQLKLFNLVMREFGPDFLKRGILLESSQVLDFLSKQPEDFWRGCREILIDGKPVQERSLREGQWSNRCDWTCLSVMA